MTGQFIHEGPYLMHYGILGMRWGVRRYQNKDGSLTEAGKKRQKSEDRLAYEEISKKKRSEMTNDELKKANERLRLEQENKRLNPSSIKKGLIFAGATAAALGTYAGIRNNGRLLISDASKFVSPLLDLAANSIKIKPITV